MIFTSRTIGDRIRKSSTDTYDQLAQWMPILGVLIIVLHPLFFMGNLFWQESEFWVARVLAIIAIVPLAIPEKFLPPSLLKIAKNYTITGLLLTGPVFMLTGLLLELSVSEPSLDIVLRRQYEFAGSFIAVALIATDIVPVLVLGLILLGFAWLVMTIFFQPDYSIFQISWITMTSGYLLLVSLILLIAKTAHLKIIAKRETLDSVGSMIAHELRTPLLTIRALSEVIQREAVTTTEMKEVSSEIVQEVDSAATLIDIFLVNSSDIHSIEKNQPFQIADAVHESLTRYPYRSARERESITSDVEATTLVGPRTLLVHVVFNLLKNAFNNIHPGRDPKIKIIGYRESSNYALEFYDNGAGISDEDRRFVFDQFFTTSKKTGSGIGLAFVRSVVETRFSGSIECESILNQSTKFKLGFPLGKPQASEPPDRNPH